MAGSETFACDLSALSAEERARRHALAASLPKAITELQELADGYAISVNPGVLSARDLGEFVGLEQRCCPFLTFRIVAGTSGEVSTLEVTGAPGAKQFIASAFGLA